MYFLVILDLRNKSIIRKIIDLRNLIHSKKVILLRKDLLKRIRVEISNFCIIKGLKEDYSLINQELLIYK